MPTLELEAFDIVVVPFPFTDRQSAKRRPALVISAGKFNQSQKQCVLAMITSAEQSDWMADYPISNLEVAGLSSACIVRLKIFTLDYRLVFRKAGKLSSLDQKHLKQSWRGLLAL